MDIQRALMERRTAHKYKTDPLPEGALEGALSAALMAPNHRLTHPWRFYVPGPEGRALIGEVGVALKAKKAAKSGMSWDDAMAEKARAKLMNPPALVIVTQVHAADPEVDKEDYATVACAIQNLSLSLWGAGIASKWSTGGVTRHPQVYAYLGIEDPEAEEIVGFVWAGYAAFEGGKVPPRPPLERVLTALP